MIAELKPYPEYKKSGSKWLGAVPVGWEVRNLRSLISKRTERDRVDLPLLSVAREKGVFVRSLTDADENHNVIPEDLSNYKVARAGNLVINKMKAWQGSMGIAPCDGIVSPAYFVFDFRIANHAFGQRLLRSKPYVAHFAQASDGVRVGQWDLSVSGMRQIPVLVPSASEQTAIVRFLDWASGRFEHAIRSKQKIVTLLNEQKRAIIHRAVTRGLDLSVPLKPSGMSWLGDIPAHWKVLRARFLFRAVTRRDVLASDPKMSVTQRRGLVPTEAMQEHSNQARNFDRFQVCYAQDLVLNKYKAHLGVFCCAHQRGLITPNYTVFRPARELCTEYFDLLLHTSTYRDQFSMIVNGVSAGMSPLYTHEFYSVPVLFPDPSEQLAILEQIKTLTNNEGIAISRLEREVEILREYRTRLIADVVTGKLDVRDAATRLPDDIATGTIEDATELIDEGELDEEEAA